jgi:hypothetical protein
MRAVVLVFAVVAFAACGSGNGSSDGTDAGSTGQCSDVVNQICQQAATCSAGGDAGIVLILDADHDAGIHASDFTINSESGCQNLVGAACKKDHAAAFTANCSGALQCGPSASHHGNGLVLPAPCHESM